MKRFNIPFFPSSSNHSSNSNMATMMMMVQTIDEDPATERTIEFKPLFSTLPSNLEMLPTRCPTVKFNEKDNQEYDNEFVIYEDQCPSLWYSARDFKIFRQQAMKNRDTATHR